jgi:acyl carrier protein
MDTTTTPLTDEAIRANLTGFLAARTQQEVTHDLDLFATGLVSSLFAKELLTHIEGAFGLTVPPEELRLDPFRTVDAMTALVRRVFGRYGEGAAAVLVPTDAPGVTVSRVPDPLGCRAAGHCDVTLDAVRLPGRHLLGGAGLPRERPGRPVVPHGHESSVAGRRRCVGSRNR